MILKNGASLKFVQVGRNEGKRPVSAVQIDDVALVVAQRDAHSTNIDRAKVDALVLQ